MVAKSFWTDDYGGVNIEFTSYIEDKVSQIYNFSKKIATAIPTIREILKDDIRPLRKFTPYQDLVGIDGSNSFPKRDPYITTFSVNAVAYMQLKTKNPPARFLKTFELIDIPTSNFSNTYMHLRRNFLEMSVYLDLTDAIKTDIVFMDGSINSQAIWNARIQQLKYKPYVIPDTAVKLYGEIFTNPNGLWGKMINRLKTARTVWLPKRIVGKSFVKHILKKDPNLELPEEATNEIFSLILNSNEILGPFPFEKWVQASTAIAKKFVKDIHTVYYKPPFHTASVIKLEFHKHFLPDLAEIIATIRNEYSIYNRQIKPITWAHTIAKDQNVDLNGLDSAIKSLTITKCSDPSLKTIINQRFFNQSNIL